jgi:hypothetical protein
MEAVFGRDAHGDGTVTASSRRNFQTKEVRTEPKQTPVACACRGRCGSEEPACPHPWLLVGQVVQSLQYIRDADLEGVRALLASHTELADLGYVFPSSLLVETG